MISDIGFLEYDAADGSRWRVEGGVDMLAFFGIDGSESERIDQLVRLTVALDANPKIKEVVFRRFGASPLFGQDDPELFHQWSVSEISEKRGLSVDDVELCLKSAAEIWRKTKRSAQASALKSDEAPREMTVEEARKIAARYGFATAKVPNEEILYLAGRCVNLEEYLESDHQRALARSMIESELILFYTLDPSLKNLQKKVSNAMAEDGPGVSKELEDRMAKMLSTRNQTQQQIQDTMKQLGINEGHSSAMKRGREFRECLSLIVEGVREYESDGSRELVDGIFTAAEVEVLTKPFIGRSEQYRPDLNAMMEQYRAGLFDPDFEPNPLKPRAHHRLMEGFKAGLANVRAEAGEILDELDPESAAEAHEDMVRDAEINDRSATASGGVEAAMRVSPRPEVETPKPRQRESDIF